MGAPGPPGAQLLAGVGVGAGQVLAGGWGGCWGGCWAGAVLSHSVGKLSHPLGSVYPGLRPYQCVCLQALSPEGTVGVVLVLATSPEAWHWLCALDNTLISRPEAIGGAKSCTCNSQYVHVHVLLSLLLQSVFHRERGTEG